MDLRRILTVGAFAAAMLQPSLGHTWQSQIAADSGRAGKRSSRDQDSTQKRGSAVGRQPRRRRGPLPDWALESWFIRRQVEAAWVLRGVNVIDVRTGDISANVNIVIAGDLIRSIGVRGLPIANFPR